VGAYIQTNLSPINPYSIEQTGISTLTGSVQACIRQFLYKRLLMDGWTHMSTHGEGGGWGQIRGGDKIRKEACRIFYSF